MSERERSAVSGEIVRDPQDPYRDAAPERRIALVDLLDRVLAGGVVVQGELCLSIADIDLVKISLRAVVASVSALMDEAGRLDQAERLDEAGRPGDPEAPSW